MEQLELLSSVLRAFGNIAMGHFQNFHFQKKAKYKKPFCVNEFICKRINNHFHIISFALTLGARDFFSAVSGFCQVFIRTRAKSRSWLRPTAEDVLAFGQHRKFPPHARKTSGTQGTLHLASLWNRGLEQLGNDVKFIFHLRIQFQSCLHGYNLFLSFTDRRRQIFYGGLQSLSLKVNNNKNTVWAFTLGISHLGRFVRRLTSFSPRLTIKGAYNW